MKFIQLFFCSLFLWYATSAQQGSETIKVTDLLRVKQLGAVALAKDGSKVAFTVNDIEQEADSKWEYRYQTQIYWVSGDGSGLPQPLTTAREGGSQPAWSPDGRQLAFVRTVKGKPQVFLLSLEGGEPRQLTKFKYGATNPQWSPDGKQLLFAASLSLPELLKDSVLNPVRSLPAWPLEKPGFPHNEQLNPTPVSPDPDGSLAAIRAYLDNNELDQKARVLNKLLFQDESNVSSAINFTHFFVMEAVPGASPRPITKGFYAFKSAQFFPDGKKILLSAHIDDTEHPDRSLENELYTVNTDGSDLRLLLGAIGNQYFTPVLSPSGKWMAFQYSPANGINIPELAIMKMDGSKAITAIPFDRNKQNLTWSPDEQYLYFSAPSNGGVPLYRFDMKTKKVEQLSDFDAGIGSFDVKGNRLVFVKTEVANPFELYAADLNLQNERRLSRFNLDWLKEKKLSIPEKHSFTNDKGMKVEYWVMKPVHFESGKKYPLLLEIHGGPSAMWGPGEASMWHEFQFFAAKGYGIVYCNPRGSGGYGQDFLRANIQDWGTGPASDVLAALDHAVAEGWADTARLTVTGGSYAGYLVAWIIGHDHRFKAACSQRGVYDLATFFGEGNAWRLVPNYFGGYPWEKKTKAILQRESPITYVQNITTPYIIFHGENDRRTGFVQGEMLYRSLKVLGRPVEYVRHPGATHEITRSGNNRQRIDQLLRTYEFFERFVNSK